jgi:fluoroquinolone transport system permease protein
MTKLSRMFFTDIRFQFLHGFYYAYVFMVIVYIRLLHFAPEQYLEPLTVMIVFTDPTLLGCFFVGGIILLEKSQGIYGPLFLTSLRVREFILAKVLSLAVISVVSSLAILYVVHRVEFNLLPVTVGILLSSIVFTLLGLLLAVRVQTVNQFLLTSPLVITVFFIPVVTIFNWWDSPVLMILPSYAGIVLLEGAFQPLNWSDVLYALLTIFIWCAGLFILAEKSFTQHVLKKGGGE